MKGIVPCGFPYRGWRPSPLPCSARRRRLSRKHNSERCAALPGAEPSARRPRRLPGRPAAAPLRGAPPQVTLVLSSLSHYFRMTRESVFRRVEKCASNRAAFEDPTDPHFCRVKPLCSQASIFYAG
ncbi:uncharacterized protein LOC144291669 [Canis aureus]